MSLGERKRIVVRTRNFCLVKETLYHKAIEGICWRAIRQFEKLAIVREAHCGIAGGHYTGETTTQKIWSSGLWWPPTMKDAEQEQEGWPNSPPQQEAQQQPSRIPHRQKQKI